MEVAYPNPGEDAMSKIQSNVEWWLAALRADAAALQAAFEEAAGSEPGLAAEVPSCPGWTILDLLHHLGSVYFTHRSHVGRGVTTRPELNPAEALGELPTGREAIHWWNNQYQQLAATLESVDPQLPAWNWAPAPKQAWFWHRRMAHETSIHRWDAQMALGHAEPIEPKLAADGVAEVLDTWLPAGRRLGPTDRTGVIRLAATDVEQEWFVRLRGEGIALLDTDSWLDHDHPARVAASGTASDLVLALFGRVPFEVLDITGEAALLESLRTG